MCNFHRGAGKFRIFRCKSLEFQLCDFLKTNTSNHMLNGLVSHQFTQFSFQSFRMLNNYISQKNLNTSLLFRARQIFVTSLFSCLSPNLSPKYLPKQKIKPASKQSKRKVWQLQQIHQQLAEVNISYHDLTEAGRDREFPQLGSDPRPLPSCPNMPLIKNHPGKYGRVLRRCYDINQQ